jgi:membrane fusion protein (multidrug efflux system)
MSEPVKIRQGEEAGTAKMDRAANMPETSVPAAAAPQKPKARRSRVRTLLFAALPVVLVAGGYVYVTGGQLVSTDNAYVQAKIAGISTDVAGTVREIDVHDNEQVKAGQVLYALDPASFRIALDAANAKLDAARNDLLTLKATYRQDQAEVVQALADLPFYQDAFDRAQKLVSSATASVATLDQARHDLEAARQKVDVSRAQAAATLAKLNGNADLPVEQYPEFLQAKAAVDDAQRQLDHTVIKAPFDGVATNVNAIQVGSYLSAAQTAFSLVSTNDMWIEANPKETELTYVKPGQPVTITVDTYPGVEWKGEVASVSPASEASFSLLPAQNTSGNWVKVVQRIPMRVAIKADPDKPQLRAGMSTVIDIDTGHARGMPQFVENLFGRTSAYAHE